MDRSIYEKAARIHEAGSVRPAGETARALYFEVEGETGRHFVRLQSDHEFNCTCKWGTLRGAVHGNLCSHVLAALLAVVADAPARRAEAAAP